MAVDIAALFEELPRRYRPAPEAYGRYYFSIGDLRYTVELTAEGCTVRAGKPDTPADCILKTTPELFEKMVVRGKMPGALDIARGKIKTNDPKRLMALRRHLDFSGIP